MTQYHAEYMMKNGHWQSCITKRDDKKDLETALETWLKNFEKLFCYVPPIRIVTNAVVETTTTEEFCAGDYKTPDQWCAHLDKKVMDPDGWRSECGPYKPKDWKQEIGLEEFMFRFNHCTVQMKRGKPVGTTGKNL